jgi:hypothetical protein
VSFYHDLGQPQHQLICQRVRIRQMVRAAGRYPTVEERQDIERRRQRLATRVRDFHITACRLFGGNTVGSVQGTPDVLNEDGYVSDDTRRPEDRGVRSAMYEIENTVIVFPSAATGHLTAAMSELRTRECRLRRAKANDTLGQIREALSGLSYQYINKVRQAATSRDHLRAYAGVKAMSKEVSYYQQVYNRNSHALRVLDPSLRSRYPVLRRSDCSISTAIADVNARGQSQVRLPWLWSALDGWDGEETAAQNAMVDNDRLLECQPNLAADL